MSLDNTQSSIDSVTIAKEWLSKFAARIASTDVNGIVALFGEHGWYRDLLTETPKALGQGNFLLLPEGSEGEWKALTVMTMVSDWKGHEEPKCELGHYEGHTQLWEKVKQKRRLEIESNPQVIVGMFYVEYCLTWYS